jgi:hypothetical protein
MSRRIKGVLKEERSAHSRFLASRNPWNTGKAAYYKRLQKISGQNRPST